MKYASIIRALNKIQKEMLSIPWTEIPEGEFANFENAYRSIKSLLSTTDIPINIDDK